MSIGGDGGAGDAAAAQRQEEVDRQNRIKSGMAEIDRIFGGGAAHKQAVGAVTSPTAGGTYYLSDGTPINIPTPAAGALPAMTPADYEFLRNAQDNGVSTNGTYIDSLLRANGGQPTQASAEMQKAQDLASKGQLFSGVSASMTISTTRARRHISTMPIHSSRISTRISRRI